ncbi:MAG: helix-turn-helix transcriptional regulator [Betaproteobacteria bacterium]|nr:helix-turn-helix transcriptional regulator [Betaproteobacteria bacterium]
MAHPELSARELQLLQLLARGKIVKTIAAEMNLTPGTTKASLGGIYKKLGVRTSNAAVAWFVENQHCAPRQQDDPVQHYRRALFANELNAATVKWERTAPAERPAGARVYVCVMYLLQDRSEIALEEANALVGQEAGLIILLHQWLSGDDNALPVVNNLISSMRPGARAKHAGLLAVYFDGMRKQHPNIAFAAAQALVTEFGHETA